MSQCRLHCMYVCVYVYVTHVMTQTMICCVCVVGVAVQLESDRRERKDDGPWGDDVGDASGYTSTCIESESESVIVVVVLTNRMFFVLPEPRLAAALLQSFDFGCGEEMLTIAAMSAVENPFINIRKGGECHVCMYVCVCMCVFCC